MFARTPSPEPKARSWLVLIGAASWVTQRSTDVDYQAWAMRLSPLNRRTVLKHTAAGGALALTGSLFASKDARGMTPWTPDPTFYPSPEMAMEAPREKLAYVATSNPTGDGRPDGITALDVDPKSATYGKTVGRLDL